MSFNSKQAHLLSSIILGLCVFVLLFAVQVKLAQYRSAPQAPDPVRASKLWLKSQKLELPAASPLMLVICLAFLLLATVPVAVKTAPAPVRAVPISSRRERFARHRFLRPPPSV